MLVSGFFKVVKLEDGDAQGFERVALCQNLMEEGMTSKLYLPPFLRKSECAIAEGSKVWGISDTVSGLGVALYGTDCDFEYWSDADLTFKQTLTVEKATTLNDKCDVKKDITSSTGDIKASVGDVVATTVSLKSHTHQIVTMTQADVATLATAVMAGGTAPVTFATFYTITPT